ncbi:kinase-like domain-containing protein [Ephemerocybe angulata]|uniref:Kinase-like domain-containing protein n=1 Tax=Ephemerocybe angulata TaxID=980116 RepID=A0A8H6I3D3_9AGAR|nr:kinase-like domain-containing protein [Tulosesus angulatus]
MAGIFPQRSGSESSILSEKEVFQFSRQTTEDSVQTTSTDPTSLGDGSSTPALDSLEGSKPKELSSTSATKINSVKFNLPSPTAPLVAKANPASDASKSTVPPRPQRRPDAKLPEVPPTKPPGRLGKVNNYLLKVQRTGQVAPPDNEYYFATSNGGLTVPRKVPSTAASQANIANLKVKLGEEVSYKYLHSLDGSGSGLHHTYAAVRVGSLLDSVSAFAAVRAYKKHSIEALESGSVTPMMAIRQELRVLRLRERAHGDLKELILGAYMVMQDSDCIYLVLPLMRCSLLDILVNPLTKALCFSVNIQKYKLPWIIQMVEGLRSLHRLGVIHRNIKPSSFLVNLDGRLILSDFSQSYIRPEAGPLRDGHKYAYRVRGRLEYTAPEVRAMSRQKKIHEKVATMDFDEEISTLAAYGREADIWSLGCIIAELFRVCAGKAFRPLFQCLAHTHHVYLPWMHDLKRECEVDPHDGYARSSAIQQFVHLEKFTKSDGHIRISFLNKFLQVMPDKRMKLGQVRDHPFLKSEKYDELLYKAFSTKDSASMVIKCDPSQESDYVPETLQINGTMLSDAPVAPVLEKEDTFCYLHSALKAV